MRMIISFTTYFMFQNRINITGREVSYMYEGPTITEETNEELIGLLIQ